jgi:nucleoside-diphosphate-sugar epimerase
MVGLIGASSLVGECILPLLRNANYTVTIFSRSQKLSIPSLDIENIPMWICLAPIWVLPEHFALLESLGIKRIVALSSTSRFTKNNSHDLEEQVIAKRLEDAEMQLQTWAEAHDVQWTILRPTLIYGLGKDKNINEIARFIRRFSFFPIFGKAQGLRQPIHATDVAHACVNSVMSPMAANRAYNISGGETITYREMITRVFKAQGLPIRIFSVPLLAFKVAVSLLRCLPRYRQWSFAMAERMNNDLVFDHSDAARDLNFKPRKFFLLPDDLTE